MKKLTIIALVASLFVACSDGKKSADPSSQYHPSDAAATEATVALYNTLFSLAERGILLGHQDDLAYGIGWVDDGTYRSDVEMVTGDHPALFGWDLGMLEMQSDANLDGVPFEAMRRNALWAAQRGGVNSFSWHGRNPLTGGDSWDVSSDKVVWSILNDEPTAEKYRHWLDAMADFFLSLRGDDGQLIPIIFRPYHELSGNWFWWCRSQCSREEYIALWQYTIDYLRGKGVNNMLVAYSMSGYTTLDEFEDSYPGDDYVDIVGFDIYHYSTPEYFIADMTTRADVARAFAAEHGKLWAVCETGYETIPDDDWFTTVLMPGIEGKGCSHVLLWRNAYERPNHFYASYPGHSSAEDMKRLAQREDVIMLSEM